MEKRVIELLQTMLYRANMGDMSVYENGDNLITDTPLPCSYLNVYGRISIPKNHLLLVEDSTGKRYGKTYQDVYEILTNWCVIDEMNASKEELVKLYKWFMSHGVILSPVDVVFVNCNSL